MKFAPILLAVATLNLNVFAKPAQGQQQIALAVMRSSGALVPVAFYDGNEWWNPWPWDADDDSIKDLDLPQTLAGIPTAWLPPNMTMPTGWKLLRPSGSMLGIQAIKPRRAVGFDLMNTVEIESNYQALVGGPALEAEGDEIGVAVAGNAQLGRIIPAPAVESRRILNRLNTRLRELEQTELARWRQEQLKEDPTATSIALSRTWHPGDRRIENPFALMKGENPFKGRTYYHLTGEKFYASKFLKRCLLNVSFDGVVAVDLKGNVVSNTVSAFAYAGYCGDAASWMTPMASVKWADSYLWLIKENLEDGYDYMVFDPVTPGQSPFLKGQWGRTPAAVRVRPKLP